MQATCPHSNAWKKKMLHNINPDAEQLLNVQEEGIYLWHFM